MSQTHDPRSQDERIRAGYDEFTVDGTPVAMVFDPENRDAWIQSDLTTTISS